MFIIPTIKLFTPLVLSIFYLCTFSYFVLQLLHNRIECFSSAVSVNATHELIAVIYSELTNSGVTCD